MVEEAVSVLCRRTAERRRDPPDLLAALETVRRWIGQDEIRWVARHAERLVRDVLDVVEHGRGRLNFNDGLLAVLQREGTIDGVATFDEDFDVLPEFRRVE